MDSLFFQQLGRNTFQKSEDVLGDPYDALPVKNKKYAKECEEIHLGSRNLTGLTRFEDFPNLEVLWINNNKLTKIEGLDINYRIKHLYAQNNSIDTLQGSLFFMKHIETLVLFGNCLTNLDNTISFLRRFKYLKHLELQENPLNEEPNYRPKMIYYLPWLDLLDKHKISQLDRIKSADIVKNDKVSSVLERKKDNGAIKKASKSSFSRNEKIIFTQAKEIRKQREEEERRFKESSKVDLSIFTKTFDKPPDPYQIGAPLFEEGVDDDKKLQEYEKSLLASLFNKRVKDPKMPTWILAADIDNFYNDLAEDEGSIGKKPLFQKEKVQFEVQKHFPLEFWMGVVLKRVERIHQRRQSLLARHQKSLEQSW